MAEPSGERRIQASFRHWRPSAIGAGVGGASALILMLQLLSARAQETRVEAFDDGPVGLAGMLAGLLIFALVALYNHHRRAREEAHRIAELEAALEASDDRIWSLEEKIARANELIDAQGDFVVREDAHGRVTHVNPAVCALLDKRPDELIGREYPFTVLHGGERQTLPDGSTHVDQEVAAAAGSRWIAWRIASAHDHAGRIVETQRVGRDVTARVETERALADARAKAEAASRAKSRFLAVVSHEVRTPLNGILGMADLLLDTPVTPEQKTYAQAVKSSGDALLGLIEEVLDFSKIEAGRLDLDMTPFDLHALITDVVELIAPRAQQKGVEVAADIDDDVPCRVVGDPARLRQVLLNLAGNAVKFTDRGGVALVVTRTRGLVRFEVNDTGPGIEPDMRRRIFREFEQGDGTLTRRHGGTGLGLAIAARIVERMGSEIVLDATDAGSRFSFAVELPEIIDAESPTHPPQLNGIDILIVSPSPIVGPLLARRLSAWGAKAVNADKDTLAETLLRERAWQHVLVDRAFGFETTMKIVGNAAKCAQYRHVLLSPSERAELEVLRAGGFDSYLVKPVRAASLAARLATPALSPPLVPEFEDEPPASREPAGGRLTVLVAEDNEINALLVQAMLARLGHAPTVVGNGIAAVTTVATAHAMGAPYDVVLMDLHLPGLDGIEATRRIRALGGNGGAVPIVALTANAFIEDREACREAGMDGFITKPVDRARLEEAIAAACATRRGNAVSAA